MIRSLVTAAGGQVHVYTGEEGMMGNPDALNILPEVSNPVELTADEADQLLANISDVRNAMNV